MGMKTYFLELVMPGHQLDGQRTVVHAWNDQGAVEKAYKSITGEKNIAGWPTWDSQTKWAIMDKQEQSPDHPVAHVNILYKHHTKMSDAAWGKKLMSLP